MIPKQNYYDGLTEEINKHVLDTIGFNIKYVIKQMSESYNDINNLSSVEINKYNEIEINNRYLIDNNNIVVDDSIKKWLNSDIIKTLCIRSGMGSGKTTLINKILSEQPDIKRVLILSYRVTCALVYNNVYKQHNFELY